MKFHFFRASCLLTSRAFFSSSCFDGHIAESVADVFVVMSSSETDALRLEVVRCVRELYEDRVNSASFCGGGVRAGGGARPASRSKSGGACWRE